MAKNRLVYHPVLEAPLSHLDFTKAIQNRFPESSNRLILPTWPEVLHLTILGAQQYPEGLLSSEHGSVRVNLPEQSREELTLSVTDVRAIGERGLQLALMLEDSDILREEQERINKAFAAAGAQPHPDVKPLVPHVTIALMSNNVKRKRIARWVESMLPPEPTVTIGGITQNNILGKNLINNPLLRLPLAMSIVLSPCLLPNIYFHRESREASEGTAVTAVVNTVFYQHFY